MIAHTLQIVSYSWIGRTRRPAAPNMPQRQPIGRQCTVAMPLHAAACDGIHDQEHDRGRLALRATTARRLNRPAASVHPCTTAPLRLAAHPLGSSGRLAPACPLHATRHIPASMPTSALQDQPFCLRQDAAVGGRLPQCVTHSLSDIGALLSNRLRGGRSTRRAHRSLHGELSRQRPIHSAPHASSELRSR